MTDILDPVQLEYIKSFRNENDPLILELDQYAKEHKVPILDWQSAQLLEQLVIVRRPKRVLEIGTAIAYSSIRIARRLKNKSVLTTIEKSEDNYHIAKNNISRAGLEDKINLVFGDALQVMPGLEKKFDMIFLDADKEDYQKLFSMSLSLLRKNGIMFVDNLLWHGFAAAEKVPQNFRNSTDHIREFNNIFMDHKKLFTTLLPVGDGIGIGIRIK